MCPGGPATVALMVAGAISSGGRTTLAPKRPHTKTGAKKIEQVTQTKGGQVGLAACPASSRRYAPAAVVAAWSRMLAAFPASVTPKITSGAFVPASTPQ